MRQDFKCSKCGSRECGLLCERGTNEPICANCVFDERDRLRALNAKLVDALKMDAYGDNGNFEAREQIARRNGYIGGSLFDCQRAFREKVLAAAEGATT